MKSNKKIIKAITRVIVQTMYQYGASVRVGGNDKNITKRVVKSNVKDLVEDDELDYSEIINAVTRKMLDGIKKFD